MNRSKQVLKVKWLLNIPEPELPKTLMVGSTGLGNSGSASGVKPKRSENSRSGRSSLGTSQYNRSNFGTRRSPLAIGLNV